MAHAFGLTVAFGVTVALLTSACGDEFTTSEDGSAASSSTGGSSGSSGGSSGDASTTGGSPSTGGNAAGPGDGGTIAPEATCPANPPVASSPCQFSNLACSFGDDPRPSCRARFLCSGSQWTVVANPTCQGDPTCVSPAPSGGDVCTSLNQVCAYPSEGVFCECPPCASLCDNFSWVCSRPPDAPCPSNLPNEGHDCASEGRACAYGSCALSDAVDVRCTAGRWVWHPPVCG